MQPIHRKKHAPWSLLFAMISSILSRLLSAFLLLLVFLFLLAFLTTSFYLLICNASEFVLAFHSFGSFQFPPLLISRFVLRASLELYLLAVTSWWYYCRARLLLMFKMASIFVRIAAEICIGLVDIWIKNVFLNLTGPPFHRDEPTWYARFCKILQDC